MNTDSTNIFQEISFINFRKFFQDEKIINGNKNPSKTFDSCKLKINDMSYDIHI